jgi:hypothetical protein
MILSISSFDLGDLVFLPQGIEADLESIREAIQHFREGKDMQESESSNLFKQDFKN